MIDQQSYKIAYFSMEIALENAIKTYSGGLGILAGDILRSAADKNFPMLGVTLLSEEGYLEQGINEAGEQVEEDLVSYDFSKLRNTEVKVNIKIGADSVTVGAWEYIIEGFSGGKVPVYLLDTNFPENPEIYRGLTKRLYGGDREHRLLQEIVLGRGGYAMLKKLGHPIKKIHLNEGHAAFAALAKFLDSDTNQLLTVRQACVFTTHTPVQAAHHIFSRELVAKYQKDFPDVLFQINKFDVVDMTELALHLSGHTNAVSLRHQEIAAQAFPEYQIDYVTNGVHSATWSAPEFQFLYDEYLPNWRSNSETLKGADIIPFEKIWLAHQAAKKRLIDIIQRQTKMSFSVDIFTIGFARRFTAYKQPTLLLQDMMQLLQIHKKSGPIQIVYSGKAHPLDFEGLELIKDVSEIAEKYKTEIKLVFLEDYEMDLAKTIVAGVDIWLNTPLPPNEASGTSGMKAAHNGVPQLSTFDGWWPEGYIKDKTGWMISGAANKETAFDVDLASALYKVLGAEIVPLYYQQREVWLEIMRNTIRFNASHFNTERALNEYIKKIYRIN